MNELVAVEAEADEEDDEEDLLLLLWGGLYGTCSRDTMRNQKNYSISANLERT